VDTLLKEEELIQAVVEAVEERCRCGISMAQDHFAGGTFRCFQESSNMAVTYRTKLLLTSPNMTEQISLWTSTSPFVSISAVLLQIDGTCPFAVEFFSDPECGVVIEGMTTDSMTTVGIQSNQLSISIGAAIGFVVLMLVLFSCIIVIIIIPTVLVWKKFKSMKRAQYT
jgi:hypothetical protein